MPFRPEIEAALRVYDHDRRSCEVSEHLAITTMRSLPSRLHDNFVNIFYCFMQDGMSLDAAVMAVFDNVISAYKPSWEEEAVFRDTVFKLHEADFLIPSVVEGLEYYDLNVVLASVTYLVEQDCLTLEDRDEIVGSDSSLSLIIALKILHEDGLYEDCWGAVKEHSKPLDFALGLGLLAEVDFLTTKTVAIICTQESIEMAAVLLRSFRDDSVLMSELTYYMKKKVLRCEREVLIKNSLMNAVYRLLDKILYQETAYYMQQFANPQTAEEFVKFTALAYQIQTLGVAVIWDRIQSEVMTAIVEQVGEGYCQEGDADLLGLVNKIDMLPVPLSIFHQTVQQSLGYREYQSHKLRELVGRDTSAPFFKSPKFLNDNRQFSPFIQREYDRLFGLMPYLGRAC